MEDAKEFLGVITLGFVALALVLILCFGTAIACSENMVRNSKNNVKRVHNDERTNFYKYCNRHFVAGVPIPASCLMSAQK